MTAKKAHTDTIILLVVPLGFCTGTELLKTRPQSSHMAFPIVNEGPPGSEDREDEKEWAAERKKQDHTYKENPREKEWEMETIVNKKAEIKEKNKKGQKEEKLFVSRWMQA